LTKVSGQIGNSPCPGTRTLNRNTTELYSKKNTPIRQNGYFWYNPAERPDLLIGDPNRIDELESLGSNDIS
jgi:hypothetical protein